MLAIFFHYKEKQFSFITRKNRVHKNRAKTGAATFSNTLSMARGYGMALLAAISVAYLIHSSLAQTTYTVGDTTGWIIPPTGAAFYSTWAGNKTFKVGDILGNTITRAVIFISQSETGLDLFQILIFFCHFLQFLILLPVVIMLPQ